MDPIRTLLLARTHTVVLDPDRVSSATTRPARDIDVDRFEDDLLQLGFAMSLDLAMTLRRLPNQTLAEMRAWIVDTLTAAVGAQRPQVPLFGNFRDPAPDAGYSLYVRRVMSWLITRREQPCPWCGQVKPVGALDPCGHLVCRTCWDGGTFAGCPICHRRVSPGEPFVTPGPGRVEQVAGHSGDLRLVHLAFDLVGVARARFEQLIARTAPLGADDRAEIEAVIDAMGPRAALWLPARIPLRETMAICVARLWLVAPDRSAMAKATHDHVRSAGDLLRVAAVLMQADPALVEPVRLRSIGRALRRALLEALDRLPPAQVVEDVMRRPGLWKRIGERLHPYEHAARLPTAALAFAAVRRTDLAAATFGGALRAHARAVPSVRISDNQVRVTPWAGAVEHALRRGDPRAALVRLGERPGELLRRADHVIRVVHARQPDAMGEALAAIQRAIARGAPATLLTLAAHVARRTAAWPRRVFFPRGELLRAWGGEDHRAPLPAGAVAAIASAVRGELVARAERRRQFARAVIDGRLAELLLPIGGLRWIDVRVRHRGGIRVVGNYRAALARVGRDVTDLIAAGARPTLWDVACVHAAARANVIYVRQPRGITTYRRRDGETSAARLARLLAGDHDGALATVPPADAPTWVALEDDDLAIPTGSAGYIVDTRSDGGAGVTRVAAADLLAELALK